MPKLASRPDGGDSLREALELIEVLHSALRGFNPLMEITDTEFADRFQALGAYKSFHEKKAAQQAHKEGEW